MSISACYGLLWPWRSPELLAIIIPTVMQTCCSLVHAYLFKLPNDFRCDSNMSVFWVVPCKRAKRINGQYVSAFMVLVTQLPHHCKLSTLAMCIVIRQQAAVKAAMRHSWNGYVQYAWAADELLPVSQRGGTAFCNTGATLLDGLGTLWIMGMRKEFGRARDWVANQMSLDMCASHLPCDCRPSCDRLCFATSGNFWGPAAHAHHDLHNVGIALEEHHSRGDVNDGVCVLQELPDVLV